MQRCSAAMSPTPTRPTTDTSAAPSETPTLDVVVTVLPADGADQAGLGEQVLMHSPCALADLPDSHMRGRRHRSALRNRRGLRWCGALWAEAPDRPTRALRGVSHAVAAVRCAQAAVTLATASTESLSAALGVPVSAVSRQVGARLHARAPTRNAAPQRRHVATTRERLHARARIRSLVVVGPLPSAAGSPPPPELWSPQPAFAAVRSGLGGAGAAAALAAFSC